MTISFHRRGEDEKTDRAWDSVRAALDELKEIEEKEFSVPVDEMEEEDDAASVRSQYREEEGASIRELEEEEEADTEALREADEMPMEPASEPAESAPKVRFRTSNVLSGAVSQLTHAYKVDVAGSAPFNLVLRTKRKGMHQQEQQ
jgi:hypothetical protein